MASLSFQRDNFFMTFEPKKILVSGFPIVVNIKKKPFTGVVAAEHEERGFLVRLVRPDQTILGSMLDSICTVQCVSDEGLAYKFECRLLSKKVPNIGLSYPSGDLQGVNVRKHPRISVSFWTAILGLVAEGGKTAFKPVGEGSIVDMNEGGCRVMTNAKYKANDTIYLSFEYKEGKGPLRFKGKIRKVRPAPHGLTYYGIQFEDPKPDFLKTVQTIIENPEL